MVDHRTIIQAIRRAEKNTSGEICVQIKKFGTKDVLSDAHKAFKRLGLHRTKMRNGVLIFVAPKDRAFAIIGDRGIHAKAGADLWDTARDVMLKLFKEDRVQDGILEGVRLSGEALSRHFPSADGGANELPDTVTES